MVDEIALSQTYGFPDVESYGNMQLNPTEDRYWQLAPDLRVHATTTKNLERILKEGVKPRGETFCRVWGEEPVGYLKSGDPAIVVLNTKDLKLRVDPEIERSEEDPVSLMHEGVVSSDRVECFCTLSEEFRPDTGKFMCSTMHDEKECEFRSTEQIYETLHDVSNWVCFCKPKH